MNLTLRQIIVGSIPTLAAILGFLWFRRKKKNPAITWKGEERENDKASTTEVHCDFEPEAAEPVVEEVQIQHAVLCSSQTPMSNQEEKKSSSPLESSFDLDSHIMAHESKNAHTTHAHASLSLSSEPSSPHPDGNPAKENSSSNFSRADEQHSHVSVGEMHQEINNRPEEKSENGVDESPGRVDAGESTLDTGDKCTEHSVSTSSDGLQDDKTDAEPPKQASMSSLEKSEDGSAATSPSEENMLTAVNISADENANIDTLASDVQKSKELVSSTTNSDKGATETVCKKQTNSDDTHRLTNGDVMVNGNMDSHRDGSGENSKDKAKGGDSSHTPAGDCDHANSDAQSEVSSDSGRGASGIETPTATSPSELNEYVVYEFDFPTDACGRLIGRAGKNINSLKQQTGTEIILKRKPGIRDFQTCSIEGTQSQVRAAIEVIKARFPSKQYREITYEQTNALDDSPTLMPQVMQLNLPEGVSLDVVVSSVVDANHVFLQQVTHPTFPSLEKLDQCMALCYTQDEVPELPRPIERGMICAAPMYAGWYRAMVTETYPDTDEVDIKYLDYGGFMRVGASLLRQIRKDFMGLPFQATECFLANVIPLADQEGFGFEASALLESLVQGMLLQAQIVGRLENGNPYIELYSTSGPQPIFINRELVNMGVARWFEMQA